MTRARLLGLGSVLAALLTSAASGATAPAAPAAPQQRQLRVCSDPDNLPFSNARGEGFENKIAEIVARDLGAPLHYTWQPQRRGFIRRTLKAGTCNLVIGVPAGYDQVVATKPYYRSSYVFVSRRDRHLRLRTFDDPILRKLRIGLHAIGDDGANPPPALSLAKRGIKNIVGFKMWDVEGVDNPQGAIIDAVAQGKIDVAIVWGPFAGYFATKQRVKLDLVPVPADIANLPVAFDMAMGIRPGNPLFKARLETVLDRRRGEIRDILNHYGIPLVDQMPLASAAGPSTALSGRRLKED